MVDGNPMTLQKTIAPPAVAISISESPDMSMLGLSDGHLRDAMAEIALQLLASGTSLPMEVIYALTALPNCCSNCLCVIKITQDTAERLR